MEPSRYRGSMAAASKAPRRARGEIETLPSGSLRVRVYAGVDPMSKKRHYLVETTPAGPKAGREAEKARTRLLAQVDEPRNPRTRATVNQLMDRYLEVVDLSVGRRRLAVRHADSAADGGPSRTGALDRAAYPVTWPCRYP